jgi:SP family general alpha glucoside:H+ symporter-like MFS transporter
MATIMESYDMQLISSFYAFPQFNKKYGQQLPNGTWQVDADWQLGLSLASLIGLIFGVFASGYLGDRYGPRYVMIAAHCLLTGFVAVIFTAQSVEILFAGELLWYVTASTNDVLAVLTSVVRALGASSLQQHRHTPPRLSPWH